MFDNDNGDALTVKGRSERRESKNNRSHLRSKSRGKKKLRCFICHKDVHFKEIAYKRERDIKKDDGHKSAKAIIISVDHC